MSPLAQAIVGGVAAVSVLAGAVAFLIWNNLNLKKFEEKIKNSKFKDGP